MCILSDPCKSLGFSLPLPVHTTIRNFGISKHSSITSSCKKWISEGIIYSEFLSPEHKFNLSHVTLDCQAVQAAIQNSTIGGIYMYSNKSIFSLPCSQGRQCLFIIVSWYWFKRPLRYGQKYRYSLLSHHHKSTAMTGPLTENLSVLLSPPSSDQYFTGSAYLLHW